MFTIYFCSPFVAKRGNKINMFKFICFNFRNFVDLKVIPSYIFYLISNANVLKGSIVLRQLEYNNSSFC